MSDAFSGLIQVAGVVDAEDVRTLTEAGVDWVGIPLRLGYHQPDVSESEAAVLAQAVRPARPVVITYCCEPQEVIELCAKVGVRTVQLHGDVSPGQVRELRRLKPDFTVVCSLIVREGGADALLARAHALAPFVDGFLTDTFDPATGASGATGRVHNWSVSAAIARQVPRPLILAGGLRADTVAEAIRVVRPAGVDVHTGIEDLGGRNDPDLTARFVAAARHAFQMVDDSP
ncbi:phosphoribosylanthranilate isomerase [Streptomyces sp. NBC_00236]|uniref:phosphoribosylanthranilate isomerase n=1 Tax=unclassified Streptomyces TaxID=2593676 RepID=UPI002E2B129E|nr:phosphoribosylanthranilate isomerase [Streptomyces sp. NBC_00236]